MGRLGCARLFVIAFGVGEIATIFVIFDLIIPMAIPEGGASKLGIAKVVTLIAGVFVLPTAAVAHAYLAETGKSVAIAATVLVALPLIILMLAILR